MVSNIVSYSILLLYLLPCASWSQGNDVDLSLEQSLDLLHKENKSLKIAGKEVEWARNEHQKLSGSMTASAVRWREMQVLLLYWRLQIILMIINRFLRLLEAKSIFAKRTRWRSPTRVACPSRQSPRSKRVGLKRGK